MSISILVVEDEAMTAMMMQMMLEHAGYRVLKSVASGEDAVKYALALKPELILMDIRLAGKMNGIEAVTEIKKTADIPVIFLSGYSDDTIKAEAGSLNPLAYIVKPVKASELFQIIESWFKDNGNFPSQV